MLRIKALPSTPPGPGSTTVGTASASPDDFRKIRYYVAKLIDDELQDPCEIKETAYEFYYWYLDLAALGFTEKAKKWSALAMQEGYDLSTIQDHHHTLAKLWAWEFSDNESSHGGNEKGIP